MIDSQAIRILVVTGPTATGKTRLAVALAERFNGEIISVDSRQVYRGMDLGTGKDLNEYGVVPYHLIDIADPTEIYHLARFITDAQKAVLDITSRGKTVILCGGTPLWIHALLKAYAMPGADIPRDEHEALLAQSLENLEALYRKLDPQGAAQFSDYRNKNRLVRAIEIVQTRDRVQGPQVYLQFDPLLLAPYYPREQVRERVAQRLQARLDTGMIEEVQALLHNGLTHEKLEFFGLEYRYISLYLRGVLSEKEMKTQLCNKIRQFVKRQDIWFRKFERENLPIRKIPNGDLDLAFEIVNSWLKKDSNTTEKQI